MFRHEADNCLRVIMHRRQHVDEAEASKQDHLIAMEVSAPLKDLIDIHRLSHSSHQVVSRSYSICPQLSTELTLIKNVDAYHNCICGFFLSTDTEQPELRSPSLCLINRKQNIAQLLLFQFTAVVATSDTRNFSIGFHSFRSA